MMIIKKNHSLLLFALIARSLVPNRYNNHASQDYFHAYKWIYVKNAIQICVNNVQILNFWNFLFVMYVNKNYAQLVEEIFKVKKLNSEIIQSNWKM